MGIWMRPNRNETIVKLTTIAPLMKKVILSSISLLLVATASASTTFQIQTGDILNVAGSNVPLSSIGVLVVDTSSNGFGGSTQLTGLSWVGKTLGVGQFGADADDLIVGVFQAADLGGVVGFGDTVVVNYSGAVTSGDRLGLFWFPTLSTVGGVVPANLSQMGFFQSDLANGASGGTSGMVLPADTGALLTLAYFDSGVVGPSGVAPSALQAFSLVPEPGRVATLSLALAFGLLRRRR